MGPRSVLSRNSGEVGAKTDVGTAKIGFLWKLMLCTQLLGMEASVNFEQLYTVSVLQTLGMPMRVVSLVGLVEGAVAMTLVPLIGWLTDQGSNTLRRQTITISIGAGLQVTGMMTVFAANIMHLTSMGYFNKNSTRTSGEELDGLLSTRTTSWNLSAAASTVDYSPSTQRVPFNVSSLHDETFPYRNISDEVLEISSEIPFKAGLGMFGFITIGLGFDTMNSVVRSFVLACIPRAEHTSLLVLGLIMASGGGLSTASLGMVDFTDLFGLSSGFEGGSLVIQASLQGILVSSLVLLGLLVTSLSGRRQYKLTMQNRALAEDTTSLHCHRDDLTGSSRVHEFESSTRTFVGGGVNFDPTLSFMSQSQDLKHQSRRVSASSEQTPLLSRDNGNALRDSEEFLQAHESSSASFSEQSANLCAELQQQQQQPVDEASAKDAQVHAKSQIETSAKVLSSGRCSKTSATTKMVFISLATYFGCGSVMMFAFTGSDFVSKAVFGGDPDGSPGSQSLARYEEGMRTAARGLVVYYATYLCICFVHPQILAKLGKRFGGLRENGCRGEYVVIHLLVAITMLLAAFTKRLEAFFSLAAVSGFQRACLYSVPFAITNDVFNAEGGSTDGKAKIGMAMSVVTAMMPFAYCSIFPMVGPLEELAGTVAVTMWLGAGCCCLASVFMVLVGKV